MAIIVEEEKKNNAGIVRVVTWLVILVAIGSAAYYVFFAQPQLIEVVAPPNLKNIEPLAKLNLNPEEVINSQIFRSLKQHTRPVVSGVGRSNPFLGF